MVRRLGHASETSGLLIGLVDELATGKGPAAIMAATWWGVARFVASRFRFRFLFLIFVPGTVIGASKCLIERG